MNLIHKDLKPENLLFDEKGNILIKVILKLRILVVHNLIKKKKV